MRLKGKELIVLALSLMLVFLFASSPLFASSDITVSSECSLCQENPNDLTKQKIKAQLEFGGGNINEDPSSDQIEIVKLLIGEELVNGSFRPNGKYLPLSEKVIVFENVPFQKDLNRNIASYGLMLQNVRNSNDIVTVTAYIDLDNDEVITFAVINFVDSEYQVLDSKNIPENADNNIEPMITDGQICGLVGVYTCLTYCSVWNFLNPIAGIICDVVCGITFVFTCS